MPADRFYIARRLREYAAAVADDSLPADRFVLFIGHIVAVAGFDARTPEFDGAIDRMTEDYNKHLRNMDANEGREPHAV